METKMEECGPLGIVAHFFERACTGDWGFYVNELGTSLKHSPSTDLQ
jgi:hypothetical protein